MGNHYWRNSQMKSTLIFEPNLFFKNNGACINPKIGLLKYGPYGRFSKGNDEPLIIRAGVISTKKTLMIFQKFLKELKTPKSDYNYTEMDIFFPGVSIDSRLNFEIKIDESCIENIPEQEINSLKELKRKQRIKRIFNVYEQKFADLAATTDPHPDIVFLPLSENLIDLCEDKNFNTGKIIYQYRTFDSDVTYEDVELFDFHNALKVIAFKHNLVTQIVRPPTMKFECNQGPATVGWNFAVSAYYKATGIPWKLSDIDNETCYVGLTFYQEITEEERNMRTSMAHVFLKTGESQVIRGKPFRWEYVKGKSPTLTDDMASAVMTDIVDLYKRQKNGVLPKRIVIHKTSPFSKEEIDGFNSSLKGIEMADYVHLRLDSGVMLFPESQRYPPIRGTLLYQNSKSILYTTGYVPSLRTYMGSSVPAPLEIDTYRQDSTPEQIAKDIMALTKLDWNNTDFNKRLPVTIGVSKKVGAILSETKARNVEPPQNYKYYM